MEVCRSCLGAHIKVGGVGEGGVTWEPYPDPAVEGRAYDDVD